MKYKWEPIDETTPSGKRLYECNGCGMKDPAPTKNHDCVPILQMQVDRLHAILGWMRMNPEIRDTYFWDEHPEDFEINPLGNVGEQCMCLTCRSYDETFPLGWGD
jgi:hypothetical protein